MRVRWPASRLGPVLALTSLGALSTRRISAAGDTSPFRFVDHCNRETGACNARSATAVFQCPVAPDAVVTGARPVREVHGRCEVSPADLVNLPVELERQHLAQNLHLEPHPSHFSFAGNGAPQAGRAVVCSDTSCWHSRQGCIVCLRDSVIERLLPASSGDSLTLVNPLPSTRRAAPLRQGASPNTPPKRRARSGLQDP